MRQWVENEGNQLEAKEKRKLNLSKNHIWEVSEMILCRLDSEYRAQFAKDINNHKAEMVRRSRIVEEETVVKTSDLHEIGFQAKRVCNSLDKAICLRYKTCSLYKAMRAAGIPVSITETDACPYRGESYDKKTKVWTKIREIPGIERTFTQAICMHCETVWTAEVKEQEVKNCPNCLRPLGEWR